jgi:NAD(P)-dependent dehydrogenase (short-subunit alcohol dehydrogenase family)
MTKTILITGGSQGIGKATALLAAPKDYIVIVNDVQNAASDQSSGLGSMYQPWAKPSP